jgi:hypothetical protein
MDVSLDSNILLVDKWLRGRHFDALLDYLERTNSKLLIHAVVIGEVKAVVREQLTTAITSAASAIRKAERVGVVGVIPPDESSVLSASMEHWENEFDEWIRQNAIVIPLNNDLLPEITNRAINRIAPFTSKAEEFRDALIWLGLLDYTASVGGIPEVAFVSNNTKQFAAPNSKDLHPTLLADAEVSDVAIQYFTSLDEFIGSRAKPIAHITPEWIEAHLDSRDVKAVIVSYLKEVGPQVFSPIYEFENRFQPMDLPDPLEISLQLNDFFVWQSTDGRVTVFTTYEVTASGTADCVSLFSAQARLETEQDPLFRSLPCWLKQEIDITADLEGDTFTNLIVEQSSKL